MRSRGQTVTRTATKSLLATHIVLRNTYMLLGLSILFSAFTATVSLMLNVRQPGFLLLIGGMYGLLFLTQRLANSVWGLASAFAFTGFMGYTLGPMLNFYIHAFANGGEIILTSLGTTALIFMSLSAYALTTRENFNYMGGMLFVAIMVAFFAGIGAMVFGIPLLSIAVSGAFALISSALILYHTSEIIHGGERNYIMATISLYVALFNLFISLLRIFSFFAGSSRD